MITRRQALIALPAATLALPAWAQKKNRAPQLLPDLVRTFVGAAHGDLDKTRAMLAETPGLLNATWDWGGGDFEAAIGGAGHMGRRDIAEFLLSQGARMDIFVAAMLGRLDILKPTLDAFPSLAQSLGPHGIALLAHAEKGGEAAQPVVAYLNSLTQVTSGTGC
jgi:hypothetical protein